MSKEYHSDATTLPSYIEHILINPPNQDLSFYCTITPQLAQKVLSEALFDRQRPLKKNRVQFLAKEMLSGNFQPVSPIAFALDNNLKVVNINGQHTLNAIVASGKAVKLLVTFTPNDASHMYTVVDNHAKRNPSDALNAIGDWDSKVTRTDVNKLGSACKILATYKTTMLEQDIYKIKDTFDLYLDSYLRYKKWVIDSGAASDMKNKLLSRMPVVVGCALIKHLPKHKLPIAEEFFFKVLTGESVKSTSPEKALHDKYLRGRVVSWGSVGVLEFKDLLMYWHAYNTNHKRLTATYTADVWSSNPNLFGTPIKFTEG